MGLKVIAIDPYRCIGCSACVQGCMNDVLRMRGGKAAIVFQEDCSQCFACEIDCPRDAIRLGRYERTGEIPKK
jgi:NAD-dependent dihydropyrimidine dehydrogenase PreA subunit